MKNLFKPLLKFTAILSLFLQCSTEEEILDERQIAEDVTIAAATTSPADCSTCTYVVPSNTNTQVVDGLKLGLKPGSVICLSAANKYGNITFKNIVGTATAPIIITNCGGTAIMTATGRPYNMKTEY
jgi:hypothetical protein